MLSSEAGTKRSAICGGAACCAAAEIAIALIGNTKTSVRMEFIGT